MSERSNFIDLIRIFCHSGHGGAGSRHFMRNKLTAMGGPDGGDGGDGGCGGKSISRARFKRIMLGNPKLNI